MVIRWVGLATLHMMMFVSRDPDARYCEEGDHARHVILAVWKRHESNFYTRSVRKRVWHDIVSIALVFCMRTTH